MIFLELFWTFFKIGLFTIGGGYAMIPLISSEVVSNGWLTEQSLIDFIAVSESTPGPFAINIATFIGSEVGSAYGVFGSFLGAICTTVSVVLPSLIIIFTIAKFFSKLTEKQLVKDAFSGLRPAVVGLIGYAFISLAADVIFGGISVKDFSAIKNTDFAALGIFVFLFVLSQIKFPVKNKESGATAVRKKKVHPILLIGISAVLGILVYGVIL
ncbi:MAG: chromate transporter [Christensenellales bacterium]